MIRLESNPVLISMLAGGNRQVLSPSASRYSIALQTVAPAIDMWAWITAMTAGSQGIRIPANQVPLVLRYDEWGEMIRGSWHVFNGGAVNPLIVVESLYYPGSYESESQNVFVKPATSDNRSNKQRYSPYQRRSYRTTDTLTCVDSLYDYLRRKRCFRSGH